MSEFGATIGLPRDCKPSQACANPRQLRPNLEHAYLCDRDDGPWVVATDSFIAAAVRAGGDGKAGFIPRPALKLIERGEVVKQLSETAWRHESRAGSVTFDCAAALGQDVPKVPRFVSSLESYLWGGVETSGDLLGDDGRVVLGIDDRLIRRLGMALGGCGLRFEFAGRLRPIRVTPLGHDGETVIDGRVGLLMPRRLAGAAA